MQTLTITRPVSIKVKVTEQYKKALGAGVQEAISRLDLQLQHMDFQIRRALTELEKQNPRELPGTRQRFEAERLKLLEARQKLVEKLKEVGKLNPGEEVIHGQVESIVVLKVGDDWSKIMGVEIVLEDDKVIAIRERNHADGQE